MQNRKFKINVLDFLIIVMVVLCIVGAVLRIYTKSHDDKLEKDVATVSFLIENVQSETKNLIKAGDRVYNEAYGCDFGTVVGNVIAANAVNYVEDNGEIVKVESGIDLETEEPYRADLYGTFKCEGIWTDERGFSIDGTHYIAPNMRLPLSFSNITATVLILDVEVKKAQ